MMKILSRLLAFRSCCFKVVSFQSQWDAIDSECTAAGCGPPDALQPGDAHSRHSSDPHPGLPRGGESVDVRTVGLS